MPLPAFATVRISLLLAILVIASLVSAHQHIYTTSWNRPLQISIYPLNADGHLKTAEYINALLPGDFQPIERWAAREAKRHNLTLSTPFSVVLGPPIHTLPPAFPNEGNTVDILWWGLRFRWWAFQHTPDEGPLERVRLFVLYHDGDEDKPLNHSLGLKKGLLGLVHAFGTNKQTAQNNIVIAHEILHTVGAIDKYEAWGSPIFPVGYANPVRAPLYPQRYAEIMAGRIPTSAGSSYMAESLRSVRVNHHTAAEIGWLQ